MCQGAVPGSPGVGMGNTCETEDKEPDLRVHPDWQGSKIHDQRVVCRPISGLVRTLKNLIYTSPQTF